MTTKIYNTQEEVEKDIIDDCLTIEEGNVEFTFDLSIKSSIFIKAGDIKAWDINAWDINAWDIKAGDIKAWDINAWDINARDIKAGDIKAGDINARDINYFAVCCSYLSFKCKSIIGTRKNSKHFCLDSEIEIKE